MTNTIVFDHSVNTIHLDMDGVVADFDKFVMERMGRTFSHMSGPGADQEMWRFLKSIPNMYLQLEPTPYANQIWDAIESVGCKKLMLTAIPRRTSIPTAEQDKRDWMAKHRPGWTVVIGPHSRDKWTHARPGDILIDDREDNIHDWVEKGNGIGILHKYDDPDLTLARIAKATQGRLITKRQILKFQGYTEEQIARKLSAEDVAS